MAAAPATPDKRKEEDRLMRSPASVAADFAMGGAAAVVTKTGAAPVERVKLLLQNQGEMLRRGTLTRPYKGIAHAFARVLREEGAAALWRGNQANVIRYFPTQVFPSPLQIAIAQGKLLVNLIPAEYNEHFASTILKTNNTKKCKWLGMAFNFAFKGYFKSFFGYNREKDGKWRWLAGNGNFFASFALGWAITTFSGACAYPFDTVRRRMMLTSGQPFRYRNGFHAMKQIVSSEGFLTLFRGVGANILCGMAGAGVLSGYDQLQRLAS
ncbi:hypothetical protein C2845_PM10G22290 [Panicum miliaceum]|uniref:ADP/ATP translocase n=1 Tax=Panicum miliaceum TaxID=4540 RepID=A0A3L6PHG6_PANMI|nr:hypothetical protein C2845_PM10G22290 [Panicum miliaceum]